MKQLTQAIFNGQPKEMISAAIDGNGKAWLYDVPSYSLELDESYLIFGGSAIKWSIPLDGTFDTTDWQNSAIDREVTA